MTIPPYTPMPSLAHELGILFGFLAACFAVVAVYIFFWRISERHEAIKEKARREHLTARGIHHARGGIHEKMVDREVIAPFEGVGCVSPSVGLGFGPAGSGSAAAGGSARAGAYRGVVGGSRDERLKAMEVEMNVLGTR